mgnify:FL=1
MSKQRRNGVARSLGGDIFITVVLIVVAAFMMLPFVYAIMQSLKPIEEIFIFPPRFFVVNPTLSNYLTLSKLTDSLWVPFSRYLVNSVVVTIAGTGFNLVVASMAAFPLAKYPFPGSKWLFRLVTTSLLFAGPVTALPQYIIVAKMGLNTLWSVFLPAVGLPLGLFLMRNFMTQIPDGMLEAARIDGAGTWRIFASIAMPMVKPAALTLIIFTFQSLWNTTGGTFIYDEKIKLLPTILNQVVTAGIARAGSGAAASVVMMIPPFIIFIILQSRIIETMAFSGIKG